MTIGTNGERFFSEPKTNFMIPKETVTEESLVKISLINQNEILTGDKN